MQKHQQWLENRNYEQHIICLTKIKSNIRKKTVKSALYRQRNQSSVHENNNEGQCESMENEHINYQSKSMRKNKITYREKELIWDNFLLGKRIMQTCPVIDKKKQEQEYRRHKKMILDRNQRNKKMACNTDFRESKLKEFTAKTCKIMNSNRLETSLKTRFILSLTINNISFFKNCYIIDDICLKFKVYGKKAIQTSQMISYHNLSQHKFMFKYYSDKQNKNQPTICDSVIQIYVMRKLQQRYLSEFVISQDFLSPNTIKTAVSLIKYGKVIGNVEFDLSVCRRNALRQ